MDGAGAWGRFFDITLPQLREVLFIVILLRAIWDFKEFDLIYLLTGGGPVTSTQTLPLLVYKQAFALNEMGGASAVAVLMMLVMLGFMLLYFRYGRRDGELSDEARRPVASPVQPLRLGDRARRVVPADLDDRHLAQAADRAVPHPAQPAAASTSPSSTMRKLLIETPVPDLLRQLGDRLRRHDRAGHRRRRARRAQPGALLLSAAASGWRSSCCSPTCCRRWC